MKFSLDWLKQHLATAASAEKIAETLTGLGLEVEEVSTPVLPPQFVVGEILEVSPHPNADRLTVCAVGAGRIHKVVCGAPNVRKGMKTLLARAGARLPSGGVIKKAAIRSVISDGMLCSASELAIKEMGSGDGIIELPPISKPGAPPPLPTIFTIALTPNRGDCGGVLGVARELAAAGLGRLKPPTSYDLRFKQPTPIKAQIKDRAACPAFALVLIRGLENMESPPWLKNRLAEAGISSISAPVDLTNYFTVDRCRPLHVFDADKVKSLSVEAAKGGENFTALDGNRYRLQKGMVAIKDGDEVISLAGVMGGLAGAVSNATKNILLECAAFDPGRIAAAGRAMKLESEARWRFERGIDDSNMERDLKLAIKVIVQVCGGKAYKPSITGRVKTGRPAIEFNWKLLAELGGLPISKAEGKKNLLKLGFQIKGDMVTPPGHRPDVNCRADLVEEVLRLVGYEKIPSHDFGRNFGPVGKSSHRAHDKEDAIDPQADKAFVTAKALRRGLAAAGMLEAVTWSFADNDLIKFYLDEKESTPLRLANPINEKMEYLRPSILPNLVKTAAENQARGQSELALFELGPVWDEKRRQRQSLSAVRLKAGPLEARADVERLFALFDLPVPPLYQGRAEGYHPGACGSYKNGKEVVAVFGSLHPKMLQTAELRGPAAGFELWTESFTAYAEEADKRRKEGFADSKLQTVVRDFAFTVTLETPPHLLIEAIKTALSANRQRFLSSVEVFDIYRGKGVENGKKSVAVRVSITPLAKTFEGAEIERAAAELISAAESECGAKLRT